MNGDPLDPSSTPPIMITPLPENDNELMGNDEEESINNDTNATRSILPNGELSPDVAEGSGQTSPTADDAASVVDLHPHPMSYPSSLPSSMFNKDHPPPLLSSHGLPPQNTPMGFAHRLPMMGPMPPIPLPGAPPMPPFGFDGPFPRRSILPNQQDEDSMEEFMEVGYNCKL